MGRNLPAIPVPVLPAGALGPGLTGEALAYRMATGFTGDPVPPTTRKGVDGQQKLPAAGSGSRASHGNASGRRRSGSWGEGGAGLT